MPNGSTAQKENLVRAAVEVVYGAVEPLRIWSPMLFPADGKLVVQDIQRAFPIFFCCIRDLANAQKFLDDKADAAAKADFGLLHYNIREISTRCSFALNFIGSYSADEQIYLSLIRDRIVHGFLKGTSNEIRSVLIARSGDLRQEKFKQMQLTEAATRTKGANRPDALAVLSLFLERQDELAKYLHGIKDLFIDADTLTNALMQDHMIWFEKGSNFKGSSER